MQLQKKNTVQMASSAHIPSPLLKHKKGKCLTYFQLSACQFRIPNDSDLLRHFNDKSDCPASHWIIKVY